MIPHEPIRDVDELFRELDRQSLHELPAPPAMVRRWADALYQFINEPQVEDDE